MDVLTALYVLMLLALFLTVSVFFISMYLDYQGLAIASFYAIPLWMWQATPRKKARVMRKKYFEEIARQRKRK